MTLTLVVGLNGGFQGGTGAVRNAWGFVASRVIAGLFAVALGLSQVVAGAAEGRWLTDYQEALTVAEQTGRPILTVFTGSDWCVHCKTLEQNVLHTSTFQDWAADRVVLLMIDLPQQGITQETRQSRSRVCIKYGVRTFPSVLLIAADGSRITGQSGYGGQSAASWVAALDGHVQPAKQASVPAKADTVPGTDETVFSSLQDAVDTARDAKRPILIMVSRRSDAEADSQVSSLINDPEFEAFAKDNFVVAKVRPDDEAGDGKSAEALDSLLGGAELPPEGVELIVTDDGQTPLFSQSGSQPPHRIVHGLRRFLAARQAVRR